MRRMVWVMGIVAASGMLLATPQLAAHAASPTSSCVSNGQGQWQCRFFESLNGAPSEISDVVPVPSDATGAAPGATIALVENPALPQNDPKNWSEVIEFTPNPGAATSAQMFSEGCSSGPTNETDISCFPPPPASQFVTEVQQGTGDDFQDCTTFDALASDGHAFAVITACSDAALAEQPGPSVPEVPMALMLPLAAVGVVAAFGVRRRLNKA